MKHLTSLLLSLTLLLLTGCGGGGGETDNPPAAATEVAAGQTAQQTLATSGGTVTLATQEGARFELVLPEGALPAGTTVSLSTASATASQRFHLRLAPAGTVLLKPATITVTLPTSMALPASGGLGYDGVPIAFTRLVDGRLQAQIAHFAGGATAATPSGMQRALAVATAASPACSGLPDFSDGGFTASAAVSVEMYGQCMVDAVNALAATGQYTEAVRLATAVAAYLQSTGSGDAAGYIAQASTLACTAYRDAANRVNATPVTTMGTLHTVLRPIFFWEKTTQQLGAVCNVDDQAITAAKTSEALALYAGKKGALVDATSVDYTDAVNEAKEGNATVQQVQSLPGGAAVNTLAKAQHEERAQPGLLDAMLQAPWQRCRDSGNYDKLIELMQLMDSPQAVKTAAQYCGTQLAAQAKNSGGTVTATLDDTLGGIAATSQRSTGTLNVATDGMLELSGPIRALQCPAGSAGGGESLQLKLDSTVLQTLASGLYLPGTLAIDLTQALRAAGIASSGFSGATLTIVRSGSPCGGFWGANPEPLLTLQLAAGGCQPKGGASFCVTPLSAAIAPRSNGLILNDSGDVLSVPPYSGPAMQFARRGAVTASTLPADMQLAAWFAVQLNRQGRVLAGTATARNRAAVWSEGQASGTVLPMPPLPTGFSVDDERIVSSAVIDGDGNVTGTVFHATRGRAGSVPAGCVVDELCVYMLVVRWSPPYAGVTVIDTRVRQDGLFSNVQGVNAAGVVAGLSYPNGTAITPAVVRWEPAVATVAATAQGSSIVAIDDQGRVAYSNVAGTLSVSPPLPHVPDPTKLLAHTAGGFSLVCSGSGADLVQADDGRRWPLVASQLVDPAEGLDFSDNTIVQAPGICAAYGGSPGGLAAVNINRLGQWPQWALRNGQREWVILTPRGQPLP